MFCPFIFETAMLAGKDPLKFMLQCLLLFLHRREHTAPLRT